MARRSLMPRFRLVLGLLAAAPFALGPPAAAQTEIPGAGGADEAPADEATDGAPGQVPERPVEVDPKADDDEIAGRITDILTATGWYRDVAVEVRNGVVFLDGVAGSEDRRDWARSLSARTDGVAAVVNRMDVVPEVSWSFRPAIAEMRRLADGFLAAVPIIVVALLVLPLAWLAATGTARAMRRLLARRVRPRFLRNVLARAVAIPVFLVGLYIVLQVAGLTQLAVSVLGGAGVLSIVIGFAFRDIVENFLASLLLSIRQPFRRGDLIVVGEHRGFVHSMNTRSTVLVSEAGNHIQIPNAEIFKSTIQNLTAAPSQRFDIEIGVGYDANIAEVQALMLGVLSRHAAVEDDPEPWALIDSLGASTVNMKGYFWFDGRAYSPLKLRSMLLRQVKDTLAEAGISMPDEAREVIFPEGVPVLGLEGREAGGARPPGRKASPESATSPAERDLSSEAESVEAQMVTPVEDGGGDLLES